MVGVTYIFMAVHYPEPGTRDEVYARMSAMADSMAGTPGLLEIGPWLDVSGDRVIGLSRWASSMRSSRPCPAAACRAGSSTTARAGRASTSTSPGPPDSYSAGEQPASSRSSAACAVCLVSGANKPETAARPSTPAARQKAAL